MNRPTIAEMNKAKGKKRPTIAEMNKAKGKKRLALFAQYLETLKHTPNVKGFTQFSLCNWTGAYNTKRDCGTPSCIAGHAAFIANKGKGVSSAWAFEDGAEWLGIGLNVAHNLFVPKMSWEAQMAMEADNIEPFTTITPQMAAKAIRRLARGAKDPSTLYAGTPLWPKKAKAK